jgi:hypothetical protein
MARKHGWQLPAHTLQIVAIVVFFLLVVAFYAFFAPFLGKQILEYVAIGVYTPVVSLPNGLYLCPSYLKRVILWYHETFLYTPLSGICCFHPLHPVH